MITTAPGRGGAGRLRRRADGPRPGDGQVPADAAVRPDARLLAASRCGCSRGSRARGPGPSCTSGPSGGSAARRRSIVLDNLSEGVLTPDIYDPDAQPALPRRARALRRRRAAVPRAAIPIARARSSRASATRRRRRCKGLRFESLEAGAGLPRPLGDALGRHAHPRHDQAPGRGDVCRGAARTRAAAARAVSLLPYGERTVHLDGCVEVDGRVLRRAARLDRAARAGAVGRRATCGSSTRRPGQLLREHRCAQPRGWHRITDEDRPVAHAGRPRQLLRRARSRRARTSARCAATIHQQRRRARRAPHPRRARAGQEARRPPPSTTRAQAALELGVADLPLRPPLPRAPARRCPLTLRQVDPLIRQLTLYRDLIDRNTEQETLP